MSLEEIRKSGPVAEYAIIYFVLCDNCNKKLCEIMGKNAKETAFAQAKEHSEEYKHFCIVGTWDQSDEMSIVKEEGVPVYDAPEPIE